MPNTIVYTADNEMPVCIHCDNFGTNFDCCKYCGAEYGWWGYRRTEVVEDA